MQKTNRGTTAPKKRSRNDPKSHLFWKSPCPWLLRRHNSADSPSNLTPNRPFFKFLIAECHSFAPVVSSDERRVRWDWESFHSLLPMLPLLSQIIPLPAYHWARVYDELEAALDFLVVEQRLKRKKLKWWWYEGSFLAVSIFSDWRISSSSVNIRQSGKNPTGTSPSSLDSFSLRTTTTYVPLSV